MLRKPKTNIDTALPTLTTKERRQPGIVLLYLLIKKGRMNGCDTLGELATTIGIPISTLSQLLSRRSTRTVASLRDETLQKMSRYLEVPMLFTRILAGQIEKGEFERQPQADVLRDIDRATRFMLADPWLVSILPESINGIPPMARLYLISLYEKRTKLRLLPKDPERLAEYIQILQKSKPANDVENEKTERRLTDSRLIEMIDRLESAAKQELVGSPQNYRKIKEQSRPVSKAGAKKLASSLGIPEIDVKMMSGLVTIDDHFIHPEQINEASLNGALRSIQKMTTLPVPFPRVMFNLPADVKRAVIWLFEESTGQVVLGRRISVTKALSDAEQIQQIMESET